MVSTFVVVAFHPPPSLVSAVSLTLAPRFVSCVPHSSPIDPGSNSIEFFIRVGMVNSWCPTVDLAPR